MLPKKYWTDRYGFYTSYIAENNYMRVKGKKGDSSVGLKVNYNESSSLYMNRYEVRFYFTGYSNVYVNIEGKEASGLYNYNFNSQKNKLKSEKFYKDKSYTKSIYFTQNEITLLESNNNIKKLREALKRERLL